MILTTLQIQAVVAIVHHPDRDSVLPHRHTLIKESSSVNLLQVMQRVQFLLSLLRMLQGTLILQGDAQGHHHLEVDHHLREDHRVQDHQPEVVQLHPEGKDHLDQSLRVLECSKIEDQKRLDLLRLKLNQKVMDR